VGLLAAPASAADLGADAARLASSWAKLGRVDRLEPRLLERGEIRPLLLPPGLPKRVDEGTCTTLVVLGALSTNFVLRFLPAEGRSPLAQGDWPEVSVAGAAELTRCGSRRGSLKRVVVEMRSPRGVLEFLVVETRGKPEPTLRSVLPHRDPGPVTPLPSSGPRPSPGPLEARASAVEARVRRLGAAGIQHELMMAAEDGSGETLLRLDTGCYRFDVLAPAVETADSRGLDVDIEVGVALTGEILGSDRTENSDATTEFCIGEPRVALLRFAGALPQAPVVLLQARWELPYGLPERWGSDARAELAEAVRPSHNRSLGGSPVYDSIGVGGTTLLPVELEPGACYVAVAAPVRGHSAAVALVAEVGSQLARNHSPEEGRGTVVAFCAGGASRGKLRVDAHGTGVMWLLGVWQTSRLPLGDMHQ